MTLLIKKKSGSEFNLLILLIWNLIWWILNENFKFIYNLILGNSKPNLEIIKIQI